MKKGERGQISAKWWKGSQPPGLAKARALELALHAYEELRHVAETHPTPVAAKKAGDALDDIDTALKAVIAEASHGKTPEMEATVAALHDIDTDKERTWLAAHVKVPEEDEDDSPFSANDYDAYLRKSQKRLRSGPMNFAVVLGRKPVEHRLALHRVQPPMTLGHMLMRETGLHLMTYGTAAADPDKDRSIQLSIDSRQLPGLRKKLNRMLLAFRPLPFTFITLHAGGAELPDIDDPEDIDDEGLEGAEELIDEDHPVAMLPEPALRVEMARILPALNTAMEGSAEKRHAITGAVERFVARIKAGDLGGARAALISLHNQIPGVHLAPPG